MIIIFYLLALFGLTVYSYSQIDLNLTLLQFPWFLQFQNMMIQLGYFNRPASTVIFIAIITVLSLLYIIAISKSPSRRTFFLITAIVALFGVASYSAFSHDLFNYIFDARILAMYHQNPYGTMALSFPHDTWIRFMQWTQRTYPYGPSFLAITAVLYVMGLGKFLLTLFWFKLFFVVCYLGSTYLIYRLSKIGNAVLFALNPLILVEAVVSPHLDIAMLVFALWAYYLLVVNKKFLAYLLLAISAAVKFATVLFFPIFFLSKLSKTARLDWLIILAFLGTAAQLFSRELLPHYFIVPLGFLVLRENNKKMTAAIIIMSFVFLAIRYIPFIFTGSWVTIKLPF